MILIKITDDTDDTLNMFIDFKAEPFSVLIYGQYNTDTSSKCAKDWASGYHGMDLPGVNLDVCGAHFLQGTNLPFDNWVVIHKFILKDVSKGFLHMYIHCSQNILIFVARTVNQVECCLRIIRISYIRWRCPGCNVESYTRGALSTRNWPISRRKAFIHKGFVTSSLLWLSQFLLLLHPWR